MPTSVREIATKGVKKYFTVGGCLKRRRMKELVFSVILMVPVMILEANVDSQLFVSLIKRLNVGDIFGRLIAVFHLHFDDETLVKMFAVKN